MPSSILRKKVINFFIMRVNDLIFTQNIKNLVQIEAFKLLNNYKVTTDKYVE